MMIREVEHVELKVRYSKKAFFVDYDVMIQQHKVGHTLKLAEW